MHRQAEVFKALKCKAFPPMCMHAHLCISFCCLAARLKTQELAHRMLSEMQKWQRAEGNIHCPENNGSILENGHFPPTRQMQAFFFCRRFFGFCPLWSYSQTKDGSWKPIGSKVICIVRHFFVPLFFVDNLLAN